MTNESHCPKGHELAEGKTSYGFKCRICNSEYGKKYRLEHKEKIKSYKEKSRNQDEIKIVYSKKQMEKLKDAFSWD